MNLEVNRGMKGILNSTSLLSVFLFILIYKNLAFVFIPSVFINILLAIVGGGLLVFVAKAIILRRDFKGVQKIFALILLVLFTIDAVTSFLKPGYMVERSYILISLKQMVPLFTLMLFVFFVNFDVGIIYKRIFWYSIPVVLFSCLEVFLPKDIIFNVYLRMLESKVGYVDLSSGSSYDFQDFGYYFFRSGSIFFEPITLGIFSAYVLVITYRKKSVFLSIISFMSLVFSGSKSAFLIFVTMLYFESTKRLRILSVTILSMVFILLFIYLFINGSDLLMGELYTMGPHFMGLVYGTINSFRFPIFGHGLGTSTWLIFVKVKEEGNYGWLSNPNDFVVGDLIVRGNGQESMFGALAYQYGIIFAVLWVLIFIYTAFQAFKSRMLIECGFLLGFTLSILLTESTFAILLHLLAFVMCKRILTLNSMRKNTYFE